MAVVNANYEFIYVDVGKNGRSFDGGSLKDTIFHKNVLQKTLHLPSREATKHGLNFVFIGDEAFALHKHLMKPFPVRAPSREWRVCKYRLSHARRLVEKPFGILSNRFWIFHTAINLKVDNIDWVVLACCALHNFVRRKTTQQRSAGTAAVEDPYCLEEVAPFLSLVEPVVPLQETALARQVREEYPVYFNGEGAGPWQEEYMWTHRAFIWRKWQLLFILGWWFPSGHHLCGFACRFLL